MSHKKYKFLKHKKGFTLIELIIVVTIIAILSTIGFMSYRSYLLDARDSTRKSELSDIYSLLDSYKIKSQLPLPDHKIDLYSSGILIGFQGYLSEDILLKIGFNGIGKDPLDQVYYTYFLTKDLRNPGVMGFLENNSITGNFGVISKIHAVDYSERYPIIFGKKLGILVDENNTPIQEITEIQASGSLELSTLTGDFKAFFDNTTSISNSLYSMDILYGTTTTGIIGNSCEQYTEEYNSEILRSGNYLINTSTGITEVYCEMIDPNSRIASCSGTMLANTYPINGNTYIQTLTGTTWEPDSVFWSHSGTICGFECLDTHSWSSTLNTCLQKINGVCGSANGIATYIAPNTNLCKAGVQTSITTNVGIFTWSCNGINDGTNANCSAIRQYKITFDGNGLTGHSPSEMYINYNSPIGVLPSNPSQTGYSFTGWYDNQTGGTQITSDTLITSDTTAYAQSLCGLDYYESALGICSPVGIGYYSPDLDNARYSCTNHNDNDSRDYTYTSAGGGANSCSASYTDLCGVDLYESIEGTCSAVGNGYYSPTANNNRSSCSTSPVDNASRDYYYNSDGNGTNSCSYTYNHLCGLDLYESVEGTCATVGNGYYSPTANNNRSNCTTSPADNASRDYYYNSDGNGTNSCSYTYNQLCGLDLYESIEGTCAAVGNGYYSPTANNTRYSCSTSPADNASRDYYYISAGGGANSCSYTYNQLCGVDLYETVSGTCAAVGIGYYSPNLNNTRTACSNYSDNTSRDYTYTSDGGGINACTASYTPLCGVDLYETVSGTCAAVGIGYYSPNLNNTRTACSNYPDNASRNYTYTSDGGGINACTASYTPNCGVDLYETSVGVCTAVGVGYYSPNLNNTRTACTNNIGVYTNKSAYQTSGGGRNHCGFFTAEVITGNCGRTGWYINQGKMCSQLGYINCSVGGNCRDERTTYYVY